jgi:histidyl-tRNA synthetase
LTVIRSIRGVKDILPDEIPRWQIIEGTARRLSELYGFQEIRVPIFETTELFARSIGDTTDIVEKEMYTFQDRDGSSLTLRPEATAGVVRAFIEHNLGATGVSQKLYYLGAMFRHERPQAGRLRQFHQYGVESFGAAGPLADVEVIALLWAFLSELGLPGLSLELNSLGDAADRRRYVDVLRSFLKGQEARLCANCRRRTATNPLRTLDCKVDACKEATAASPKITEHLSASSQQHFQEVCKGLEGLRIPCTLNHRLVRGLDYYTLTTFEVTTQHLGAQNAVAAGGRYDELVAALGGPPTPAVGFAVGLERVSLMLPQTKVVGPTKIVYVAGFGTKGASGGLALLQALRASGIAAECDFKATSLKNHLRQADRKTALYTIIVGDDEVDNGSVLLRNMVTKEQSPVPIAQVVGSLRELLFHV